MRVLIKTYQFLNLISIDVACGAMVCAAFFANIFEVQLRIYGIASLGISVWIIYTLDHLLDGRQLSRRASTLRLQFHQRHFKMLSMLLIVAGLLDVYMIMNIRRPIFSWGLGLAGIVTLYLLLQRWISPFKEIVGAFLYSGGVLLPTLSLQTNVVSMSLILFIIAFMLTALINLIIFSMLDIENDLKHAQSSFATTFGHQNTRKALIILFLIHGFIVLQLLIASSYRVECFILLLMNSVLMAMFIQPDNFKYHERYRLVGDIIFLFPLPYLILNA